MLDIEAGRTFAVMKRIALVLALTAAGCGGSSPVAPSIPAAPQPQTVEVRDGWTGAPVSVTVPPALPGSTVSVSAPGYLTRVQVFNGPVYLWPQDEAFVRQLVYGEPVGGLLTRWTRGFTISAPGYESMAAQVAAEVSRVTGLAVSVAAQGDVTVSVDPADPYWSGHDAIAYTVLTLQGHNIVSARVVFRADRWVSMGVFLHELGHAIGLSHTDANDIMSGLGANPRSVRYSDRETVAIRMMYAHRAAGNAPPDRDGGATSASVRTVVIAD